MALAGALLDLVKRQIIDEESTQHIASQPDCNKSGPCRGKPGCRVFIPDNGLIFAVSPPVTGALGAIGLSGRVQTEIV